MAGLLLKDELDADLSRLLLKLKRKRYQPSLVRITIAKVGGGERKLGIPTVRDRVASPYSMFSRSNYIE